MSRFRQKATPSRIRAIASAGRRRPRDRAPRFDATVDHRPLDAPDAGLKEVRIERTAERPAFGSGQEMWDWVLYGNPIPGMLVADLEEEQQATIRQVLDGMLRERSGGNGPAVLTNTVNIGIGTK